MSASKKSITQESVFKVLQLGERKIQKIYKKVILFVGLTRAGKSTSFNWALDNKMIGAAQKKKVFYQSITDDLSTAQMSPSFISTTLIPNIAKLPNPNGQSDTSLIDMAGFLDSRNYVGVMGVSYFLKSVFEHANLAKFVIVVSQNFFEDNNGQNIVKTFNGFFNMFNIKILTPQTKLALFNSVSLLVTRADSLQCQDEGLKTCIDLLNNEQHYFPNKQLIMQLLDHLVFVSKIQYFPEAVVGEGPPKFDMFNRMNKFGWQFFDVKKAELDCNSSQIINIPFAEDYKNLQKTNPKDITKFKDQISKKINYYQQFTFKLQFLLRLFISNWNTFVNDPSKQQVSSIFKYSAFFEEIQKYLEKIDVYETQKILQIIREQFHQENIKKQAQQTQKTQQLSNSEPALNPSPLQSTNEKNQQKIIKSKYEQITFVGSLKRLIKLFNINEKFREHQDIDFIPFMTEYRNIYEQIIRNIFYFTKNDYEKDLLIRLRFILFRGFHQFSKFYQIDRQTIHRAQIDIKDKSVITLRIQQFVSQIITKISQPVINCLFQNFEQIGQFQTLIKQCEQYLQNTNSQNSQFSTANLMFAIFQNKINISLQSSDQASLKNSTISLISWFLLQKEHALTIQKQQNNQDSSMQKLTKIYCNRYFIILNLGMILPKFKKYKQAKLIALNLMKHINCPIEVENIYDQIIAESSNNLAILSQTYQHYAQYCIYIGKIQKAIDLLNRKKKVNILSRNFTQIKNTCSDLQNVYNHSLSHSQVINQFTQSQYRYENYQQMMNCLIEDTTVCNYLNEIGSMLASEATQ